MIIYGRNPVKEALAAGRRPIKRIWALRPEEWLSGQVNYGRYA